MPPSMQAELTCIIAGVLIAVFNPLGRVPAAGRGRSFKGAQQDGRLGTRQASSALQQASPFTEVQQT
jgi:hypothetical protein